MRSDYEIIKEKYEQLLIELTPMKIQNGVLKSENRELKRKLKIKENELKEISYLVVELMKGEKGK